MAIARKHALGMERVGSTGHRLQSRRERQIYGAGILLAAFLTGIAAWLHWTGPERALPFRAIFNKTSVDNWTAYGGTWEVVDGSMRNDSDERGAKLLTGSPRWKDYSIDADVQLLGLGDAGVVARVSDAEPGVDAYRGYYAGLRTFDNALVVGRVDHVYQQYPSTAIPEGIRPFRWYHLRLALHGCEIVATATWVGNREPVTNRVNGPDCIESGRVGLRSYASGGVWRNVVVRRWAGLADRGAVRAEDLPAPDLQVQERRVLPEYFANTWPGGQQYPQDFSIPVQTIRSLRFLPSVHPAEASVRGLVVLTKPGLYVQDSTGGVAVEAVESPSLKIGDEVQATGSVDPGGFSAVLHRAKVRLLWEGSPEPPVSVTANQAAAGAFDATFIQIEGRLKRKSRTRDGRIVLSLESGPQSFGAIISPGRSETHMERIREDSLLRLRGLCVVDSRYTNNLTPFVLLVRSSEDVEQIVGPPWWSLRSLIPISLVVFALLAASYHLYILAKHWRLQAIVEERGRLAHEIHDTLAQSFAGIGFQLQAIKNSMPPDTPGLASQVHLACDLVRHSHLEARRSIASLRPESLESAPLLAALKACADRMVHAGTVMIEATSDGSTTAVPLRIKDTLFRIGQEAIANAIRHARPSCVRIRVRYRRGSVSLTVSDDGVGFDAESDPRGFGLIGMRRRAESISADLSIRSAPGRGTDLEVEAPLPARLTISTAAARVWTRNHDYGKGRNDPYSHRG